MIYMIRHGQTALNQAKLLQGRSDHPLNEQGVLEAKSAAERFQRLGIRFDRVYSSPLQRAVETARLVAGREVNIHIDERLIEMDYGSYEGMDLTHPKPEIVVFFSDFVHQSAPEGMEPLQSVTERLGAFLEDLKSGYDSRQNVLLSTHAIALKGALEYLTPESRGSYWSKTIYNCTVYQTDIVSGSYLVPVELPEK